MLKGPNAFEFDANLTMYVVHPVTVICCSTSVLQPGALLTTNIVYRDIRGFLFNKYRVNII